MVPGRHRCLDAVVWKWWQSVKPDLGEPTANNDPRARADANAKPDAGTNAEAITSADSEADAEAEPGDLQREACANALHRRERTGACHGEVQRRAVVVLSEP